METGRSGFRGGRGKRRRCSTCGGVLGGAVAPAMLPPFLFFFPFFWDKKVPRFQSKGSELFVLWRFMMGFSGEQRMENDTPSPL